MFGELVNQPEIIPLLVLYFAEQESCGFSKARQRLLCGMACFENLARTALPLWANGLALESGLWVIVDKRFTPQLLLIMCEVIPVLTCLVSGSCTADFLLMYCK